MRVHRGLWALILAGVVLFVAVPGAAQQAAEDAAKKAVKKAAAPDALDLNTATPEQLAKLGLDDAKLKDAIPADTLTKLQGKVTVTLPAPAK